MEPPLRRLQGQTVLLTALLRELDIAAEPVLVDSEGGDGTDQRLPSPGMFNHVVVKATIAGKIYWLDGTRLGDRRLALLPPPPFRWALALRKGPAALEKVVQEAPLLPEGVDVLDVDATLGFNKPAKVSAERIYRGEGVFKLRTALSGMAPEDASRAQDAMWREVFSWVEPSDVAWRYDEQQGVVVMTMKGEGKLDWLGDDISGRALDMFNAGFAPPAPLRRPKEQDQTVPWATDFPAYYCWATTIRLPASNKRFRWEHNATAVNRKVGGIAYWRQANVEGDVVRSVVSKRTYLPELSQAEAQDVNDRIPSFSKYVSRVYQVEAGPWDTGTPAALKQENPPVDWSSPSAPCAAPDGQQADEEAPVPAASRSVSVPPPLRPRAAPTPATPSVKPEADVDTEPRQDPQHPVTQPAYPAESVWNFEEGAVILGFVVKKDGTVDAPSIAVNESTGFAGLDAAAIAEAATWRFLPATKRGKPVAAAHQFRVVFELKRPRPIEEALPETPAILREDYQNPAAPSPDPQRPITQPPYPDDARAAGQEGDVILQFMVEADGFVDPNSIVVKKSSGFPSLDRAAVSEAAVNWRFRPATMNGKPVASTHRFRVVFDLNGADQAPAE